jgi:hypothetical protein
MSRVKSIAVAVTVCAALSAILGAAGAHGAGLTAVKCVKAGAEGGKYANSHCETPQSPGEFETVPLELNQTTELEGEAVGTPIAQATIAGIQVQQRCGTIDYASAFKNVVEGEEMRIQGTISQFTLTECVAVLVGKPTRTCDVEGITAPGGKGTISFAPMTASTGPEHKATIKPAEAEVFTKFKILTTGTECFFKTAVPVEVKGSIDAVANTEKHSHLTFTPATNGNKIKANGAPATLEATIKGWMKGEPETTVGAETF